MKFTNLRITSYVAVTHGRAQRTSLGCDWFSAVFEVRAISLHVNFNLFKICDALYAHDYNRRRVRSHYPKQLMRS